MKKTIETHSPEETIAVARRLGALLRAGDIIAYQGGLGAGKTTFTRGLAAGLHLPEAEVHSPTFALVNEYHGAPDTLSLYHFDMYRISTSEALHSTGFFDYPLSTSVFAIEWAENIIDALPEDCFFVTIEPAGENDRTLIIEGDERLADFGD